jgi:hypothetical protein
MASAIEAMGMSLPNSSAQTAVSKAKREDSFNAGAATVALLEKSLRPRDIMVREAFENAITVVTALGGSTNAVLHLLAIAHSVGVKLSIDDFTRVGKNVPVLADLKPSGVRFDFVGAAANEATGRNFVRIARQTAGLPDQPGGLIATIELDGAGTANQASVPSGLASAYYAALLTLQYEGTIVTRGRDVRGDCKVGNAVNLSNGRAVWATMRGVVQAVSEDISSGATTIDFGPPERLPAQDFVDQLMFVRRKREPTNLQSTMTCRRKGPDIDDDGEVPDTGDDEVDNPDAGVDPDDTGSTVNLTACEGGEEVVYAVKGQRASG